MRLLTLIILVAICVLVLLGESECGKGKGKKRQMAKQEQKAAKKAALREAKKTEKANKLKEKAERKIQREAAAATRKVRKEQKKQNRQTQRAMLNALKSEMPFNGEARLEDPHNPNPKKAKKSSKAAAANPPAAEVAPKRPLAKSASGKNLKEDQAHMGLPVQPQAASGAPKARLAKAVSGKSLLQEPMPPGQVPHDSGHATASETAKAHLTKSASNKNMAHAQTPTAVHHGTEDKAKLAKLLADKKRPKQGRAMVDPGAGQSPLERPEGAKKEKAAAWHDWHEDAGLGNLFAHPPRVDITHEKSEQSAAVHPTSPVHSGKTNVHQNQAFDRQALPTMSSSVQSAAEHIPTHQDAMSRGADAKLDHIGAHLEEEEDTDEEAGMASTLLAARFRDSHHLNHATGKEREHQNAVPRHEEANGHGVLHNQIHTEGPNDQGKINDQHLEMESEKNGDHDGLRVDALFGGYEKHSDNGASAAASSKESSSRAGEEERRQPSSVRQPEVAELREGGGHEDSEQPFGNGGPGSKGAPAGLHTTDPDPVSDAIGNTRGESAKEEHHHRGAALESAAQETGLSAVSLNRKDSKRHNAHSEMAELKVALDGDKIGENNRLEKRVIEEQTVVPNDAGEKEEEHKSNGTDEEDPAKEQEQHEESGLGNLFGDSDIETVDERDDPEKMVMESVNDENVEKAAEMAGGEQGLKSGELENGRQDIENEKKENQTERELDLAETSMDSGNELRGGGDRDGRVEENAGEEEEEESVEEVADEGKNGTLGAGHLLPKEQPMVGQENVESDSVSRSGDRLETKRLTKSNSFPNLSSIHLGESHSKISSDEEAQNGDFEHEGEEMADEDQHQRHRSAPADLEGQIDELDDSGTEHGRADSEPVSAQEHLNIAQKLATNDASSHGNPLFIREKPADGKCVSKRDWRVMCTCGEQEWKQFGENPMQKTDARECTQIAVEMDTDLMKLVDKMEKMQDSAMKKAQPNKSVLDTAEPKQLIADFSIRADNEKMLALIAKPGQRRPQSLRRGKNALMDNRGTAKSRLTLIQAIVKGTKWAWYQGIMLDFTGNNFKPAKGKKERTSKGSRNELALDGKMLGDFLTDFILELHDERSMRISEMRKRMERAENTGRRILAIRLDDNARMELDKVKDIAKTLNLVDLVVVKPDEGKTEPSLEKWLQMGVQCHKLLTDMQALELRKKCENDLDTGGKATEMYGKIGGVQKRLINNAVEVKC